MENALADKKVQSGTSRTTGSDTPLELFLARRMREIMRVPGRTKRSAVRLAIVAAIRDGLLKPGEMLPPEKRLTSVLGVALGTVQAALRQLQLSDTIVRRRGDGSRVASIEPLSETTWHFRFRSKKDDQPLRFTQQDVQIDLTDERGEWSDYLKQATQYIRIARHMAMSDRSVVYAEMYLDAGAVPGLDRIDPEELDMVNIRPYLEEMFGLSAIGTRHSVRTTRLTQKRSLELRLTPDTVLLEIRAEAYAQQQEPVYFQRIYADSDGCILDF